VVGAEGDELARSVAPTKAARLLEEQEARDSLRPLTSKCVDTQACLENESN
jgi:hypothetical protein